MRTLIAKMDSWLYPRYSGNWDDTMLREHILRTLTTRDTMLDLGAGAGILCQMNFKGLAGRVCGIDLDPRILTQNRYLDEALCGTAEAIPYPRESFDFVVANNVMEHIPNPQAVYREIFRVLKPGGQFVFKTPNKWHYMPLIARLTPLWFHQFVNRMRGRKSEDTFPTKYLANSLEQITALAKDSGLVVETIRSIEGRPEYMRLTPFTYILGFIYERIVNRVDCLAGFRIVLIGHLRKP